MNLFLGIIKHVQPKLQGKLIFLKKIFKNYPIIKIQISIR